MGQQRRERLPGDRQNRQGDVLEGGSPELSTQQPNHDRLESEAAFHDEAFATGVRAPAHKFYAVTSNSRMRYRDLILKDVRGKRVLEYGCGPGSSAFEIARRGGRVVGIDISRVGLDLAAKRAKAEGVSDRTEFMLMNAEELSFADASFDLIVGTGILHHLDLEKSYAELARVLKPGGVAVFSEPLGHNPLINWYRRRTPHLRTSDEHPLLMSDLMLAKRRFASVNVSFHHLTSLTVVPFRSTPLFRPLYALTEGLDRILWSIIPPLRSWAWCAVLEIRKR